MAAVAAVAAVVTAAVIPTQDGQEGAGLCVCVGGREAVLRGAEVAVSDGAINTQEGARAAHLDALEHQPREALGSDGGRLLPAGGCHHRGGAPVEGLRDGLTR